MLKTGNRFVMFNFSWYLNHTIRMCKQVRVLEWSAEVSIFRRTIRQSVFSMYLNIDFFMHNFLLSCSLSYNFMLITQIEDIQYDLYHEMLIHIFSKNNVNLLGHKIATFNK